MEVHVVTWPLVADTELMGLSGNFMCPQGSLKDDAGVADCPGLESTQGQPALEATQLATAVNKGGGVHICWRYFPCSLMFSTPPCTPL